MGRTFAALYDICTAPSEAMGLRRMRRRLLSAANGRVLEVGAGTGANLPLYPADTHVVATEYDESMARQARKHLNKARAATRLLLADAQALPFDDAAFDTAVGTLVFCTISEPLLALGEVRRVLRPGGRLLLLEHVRWENDFGRLQDGLTPLWKRFAHGCHLNRRTLETVRMAGFEVEGVRAHHTPQTIIEVSAVRPQL